jgi:uncharacterized damage-inducible protein DinB
MSPTETGSRAEPVSASAPVITAEQLVRHWQGHRGLTRRVIEAFPEHQLFDFSIGGMRPFSALAMEMISLAGAGIRGLALRDWTMIGSMDHHAGGAEPHTRAELLARWDAVTEQIDTLWPGIPAQRFQEQDTAFGAYEGPIYGLLLYWIDNEIHHRGQGYVYLRALGIEPPGFYDR